MTYIGNDVYCLSSGREMKFEKIEEILEEVYEYYLNRIVRGDWAEQNKFKKAINRYSEIRNNQRKD